MPIRTGSGLAIAVKNGPTSTATTSTLPIRFFGRKLKPFPEPSTTSARRLRFGIVTLSIAGTPGRSMAIDDGSSRKDATTDQMIARDLSWKDRNNTMATIGHDRRAT